MNCELRCCFCVSTDLKVKPVACTQSKRTFSTLKIKQEKTKTKPNMFFIHMTLGHSENQQFLFLKFTLDFFSIRTLISSQ